jgi:hypothetical protein
VPRPMPELAPVIRTIFPRSPDMLPRTFFGGIKFRRVRIECLDDCCFVRRITRLGFSSSRECDTCVWKGTHVLWRLDWLKAHPPHNFSEKGETLACLLEFHLTTIPDTYVTLHKNANDDRGFESPLNIV